MRWEGRKILEREGKKKVRLSLISQGGEGGGTHVVIHGEESGGSLSPRREKKRNSVLITLTGGRVEN